MTVSLTVLLIAMGAQTALFVSVFLLVANRPIEALRSEVREDFRRLRRYVDDSVSAVSVESQVRDTDLRRQMDEALRDLQTLPQRCEAAMYRALNVVMSERADDKARADAASARELMLRSKHTED